MSVKFKLASSATQQSIERLLGTLADRGLKADRLFPTQKRQSLARIFVIRSPKANVSAVQKALEPFGSEVEYVEGEIKRKPLG